MKFLPLYHTKASDSSAFFKKQPFLAPQPPIAHSRPRLTGTYPRRAAAPHPAWELFEKSSQTLKNFCKGGLLYIHSAKLLAMIYEYILLFSAKFSCGKRENDTRVIFDVFSTAGTRLCRAEWRWQSPGSKVSLSFQKKERQPGKGAKRRALRKKKQPLRIASFIYIGIILRRRASQAW
ncbi:MAG: hypothetical protein IKJ74_05345 [Clostridia bacterium]|nr:hypothetical protein [Clostridia bacterium]